MITLLSAKQTLQNTYQLLIVVDTASELPSDDVLTFDYASYRVAAGTEGIAADTAKKYIRDSQGNWTVIPVAGGGFTPTDEQQAALDSGIDATKVAQIATNQSAIAGHDMEIMALSTQQSTQHSQIVAIQNQLPDFTKIFQIFGGVGATIIGSGENLNTAKYTETGCYICENGTIAASLVNSPVNYAGFVLLVYSSGNKYRIILPTSGGTPQVFIETVTGGGSSFNPWFKLVGTAI